MKEWPACCRGTYNAQQTKETNTSALSGIQTLDPKNQAAADLGLSLTATGISIKYNYNEQIKEKETLRVACREEINLHSTSIEKPKDRDNMENVTCEHKYQIKRTLIKKKECQDVWPDSSGFGKGLWSDSFKHTNKSECG